MDVRTELRARASRVVRELMGSAAKQAQQNITVAQETHNIQVDTPPLAAATHACTSLRRPACNPTPPSAESVARRGWPSRMGSCPQRSAPLRGGRNGGERSAAGAVAGCDAATRPRGSPDPHDRRHPERVRTAGVRRVAACAPAPRVCRTTSQQFSASRRAAASSTSSRRPSWICPPIVAIRMT